MVLGWGRFYCYNCLQEGASWLGRLVIQARREVVGEKREEHLERWEMAPRWRTGGCRRRVRAAKNDGSWAVT